MMNIRDLGSSSYDENALWDVVRKASFRPKMDPVSPPPGSRSIAMILSDARSRLNRLTPTQAYDELHDAFYPMPTLLVDIRPQSQRDAEGSIEGSLIIERNDLEWKFDPRCGTALEFATRYDLRVIIFCRDGSSSSLAAIALHDIGLLNATDIVGGFAAWQAAGLPLVVKPLSSADSDSPTRSVFSYVR
jgi:rhodanese-related sulfurtransferase